MHPIHCMVSNWTAARVDQLYTRRILLVYSFSGIFPTFLLKFFLLVFSLGSIPFQLSKREREREREIEREEEEGVLKWPQGRCCLGTVPSKDCPQRSPAGCLMRRLSSALAASILLGCSLASITAGPAG